jgi:hypothetical protein
MRHWGANRHDEGLLQVRRATVHEARPDDGMPLELPGQRSQEGVALERVGSAPQPAWTENSSLSGMGEAPGGALAHDERHGRPASTRAKRPSPVNAGRT